MIIACPACATRYVVPDSAVGVDGRTVRCAKCRHSWFQDGHELSRPDTTRPDTEAESPAEAPAAGPPIVPPAEPSGPADDLGHASENAPEVPPVSEPRVETPTNEPAFAEGLPTKSSPSSASMQEPEAEHSQFDYEPPFRSRRNPLKIWTVAAAIFAAIAFGTIAAVSYLGMPEWAPFNRPTFAANEPDLVLDFPRAKQDRDTLPDGTEFFEAEGTITNVGRESRSVPSILIVMRDEREKIVYSWVVAPPQRSLAPGEKVTVSEAVTDVPRSAKFVEIGWKPN